VLILDTSGLLAALDRRDPHHSEAVAALRADSGPFIVPSGVMAEVAYMVSRWLGVEVLEAFLRDIDEGRFSLDCGESDLARIRELVRRYADLPLDYPDAAVVACAERRSATILTYDHRHFPVVAREGTVRIVGFEGE
jgi:predicted nucleic acid-binding protein